MGETILDLQQLFYFESDVSKVTIPSVLNNPFRTQIPEIAQIAATEFQQFIQTESEKWKYDFDCLKGKMFGVLVVQKTDSTYGFLGTVSGKLPNNAFCEKLAPSVFDVATDNYFINRGMTELTEIGKEIKQTLEAKWVKELKERSRVKSIALQRQLFENYHFDNFSGQSKNVLEIFDSSSHRKPPVAAGECAAPKLLQFAIKNHLKPVAMAEFWWGKSTKEKQHLQYYPACKDRCRPILEYILEDNDLYSNRSRAI